LGIVQNAIAIFGENLGFDVKSDLRFDLECDDFLAWEDQEEDNEGEC